MLNSYNKILKDIKDFDLISYNTYYKNTLNNINSDIILKKEDVINVATDISETTKKTFKDKELIVNLKFNKSNYKLKLTLDKQINKDLIKNFIIENNFPDKFIKLITMKFEYALFEIDKFTLNIKTRNKEYEQLKKSINKKLILINKEKEIIT